MRNFVKLILVLCLCLSLLSGCVVIDPESEQTNGGAEGTTTVPEDVTGGNTPEETTTEKPVNIVEDPMNNGEGDPMDAIDATTEGSKPGIDIDVDGDGGDEPVPTEDNGSNNNSGSTGGTTGTTEDDDDDFNIDFGDLLG